MGKEIKTKPDPSRSSMENNEKLEEMNDVNAPKSRFQQKQQVDESISATDTKVGDQNYSKKSAGGKGTSLKQDIASKVLVSGSSGAASLETASVNAQARNSATRTMTYSGTEGTILGSASGTPNMGRPDRADSRFGRRMDATNKKINYLVSEQVVVEYDQATPLAETDSVQGYNGTPKNSTARMGKARGTNPVDLLYDRSIDEISRDELFFTSGQYVAQSNVEMNDFPTVTWDKEDGEYKDFTDISGNPMKRGSYMPKYVKVTFGGSGTNSYVAGFEVVEEDVTPTKVPYNVLNLSGTNAIIDMNAAEIDRQAIDNQAGNETLANWSALARAVKEPTATVGYLRDMELIMGSEIYAAYRFANKALAYQLNKASKDGQNTTRPMREMLLGLIAAYNSSKDFEDNGKYNDAFDGVLESRGAASLLIDIFDSKAKYKNKADVLTQPRSLKMHLQTADNNLNCFRIKPEFAAALNSRDVFSTIDRGYDAMGPVCITDCVRLIHPVSWRNTFKFTSDGTSRSWDSNLFCYRYKNRMSYYNIKVTNPLLAGIAYFMDIYAGQIHSKIHGDELIIPIVHSTRYLSLWDFLVCACVPYIQYERTNALKDILDYEQAYKYPFSQLKDLGAINPLAAVNYTLKSRDEPLEVKEMLPSTAISWIMPEVHTKLDDNKTLLPFYFTEGQFDFASPSGDDDEATIQNGARLSSWAGMMAYPVTRAGVRNGYLDDLYSLSERDLRLCLDRLVVPVGWLYSGNSNKLSVYKYSQATEGLVIDYKTTNKAIDIIRTPRELGWFMVAPAGACQPTRVVKASEYKIENAGTDYSKLWYDEVQYAGVHDTSYRIRCWFNAFTDPVEKTESALDTHNVVVDRAQNFTQQWRERAAIDYAYIPGLYVSITAGNMSEEFFNCTPIAYRDVCGANNNALAFANIGYLNYETSGVEASTGIGQSYTTAKLAHPELLFYNRIQKLPFVLNPFDACKNATCDPFAFAALLNFAGFMESDYNEDCYNRIVQAQNQGWLYRADPFVQDSPVFKDSYRLAM